MLYFQSADAKLPTSCLSPQLFCLLIGVGSSSEHLLSTCLLHDVQTNPNCTMYMVRDSALLIAANEPKLHDVHGSVLGSTHSSKRTQSARCTWFGTRLYSQQQTNPNCTMSMVRDSALLIAANKPKLHDVHGSGLGKQTQTARCTWFGTRLYS